MTTAKKKVLIISYYWPPAGGVAVQRWYNFATYLPEFGYEPIIFTVKDGEFGVLDHSKDDLSDRITVLREPILEPYKLYKKFTGKKSEDKIKQEAFSGSHGKEGLAVWIRGNFFIPDARKYWVKRSVKRLSSFLRENHVDAIISNGTPHSCHLIGMKLKRKFNIPWLADFRDPWTKVDYFDDLKLTSLARRKHYRLEYNVLENADAVTTVSKTWEQDFAQLGAKNTATITNGFDRSDFSDLHHKDSDKFVITHLGTLSKFRFHEEFWNGILEKVKKDPAFKQQLEIRLIGNVDETFFRYFHRTSLIENVVHISHLDHKEALAHAVSSDALLLLLGHKSMSEGRIPAKVFEYLAVAKPILAYGQSPSDVEKIILESNAGIFVPFDDSNGLNKALDELFLQFKTGNTLVEPKGIEKFERKNLTAELANVLDGITGNGN